MAVGRCVLKFDWPKGHKLNIYWAAVWVAVVEAIWLGVGWAEVLRKDGAGAGQGHEGFS